MTGAKTLKAVVFDMDGIIIDSEPIYHLIEMEMFKNLGLDIDEEYRYRYVGIRTQDMWTELKRKFNITISVEELVKIESKRIRNYLTSQNDIEPIKGIREILKTLKDANIRVALASSSAIEDIKTVLEKTSLKEYFGVIISGDHVKKGKPAPDIFKLTLLRLNEIKVVSTGTKSEDHLIKANNCIVIEDANSGVEAAKLAGMKCIAYRNPNSGNQDLSKADLIIDNFQDLSLNKMISLICKNR